MKVTREQKQINALQFKKRPRNQTQLNALMADGWTCYRNYMIKPL